MKKRMVVPVLLATALILCFGQSALAQDEWKFGIGTGFSSFSLDGDIGFATPGGGVVFTVDLDNGDTSDLFESGFGLGGFAAKGKWRFLYALGTVTLEDSDAGLVASWDRTQIELAGVYNFAKTGKHSWGVLFGIRNTNHEWEFSTALASVSVDEDWTDALIGITHAVPFSGKWSWSNRLDAGFGDSESSYLFSSAINWHATKHWVFNFNVKQVSIEFGEVADIANSDFYLYDVDEPAAGIGFLYTW